MLASAYHWSKKDILETVYLDELWEYKELIQRRQIAEYKMQLSIVQNPHIENDSDRNKIWEELDRQLAELSGEEFITEDETLDRAGFAQLKIAMSDNPKIIVK